jgi:hypothetical protein
MLMANKRKKFSPEEKVGLLRLHATGYITPKDKLAGRTEIIPARRESKLAAAREARKAKRKASPTIRPRGVPDRSGFRKAQDFALLNIMKRILTKIKEPARIPLVGETEAGSAEAQPARDSQLKATNCRQGGSYTPAIPFYELQRQFRALLCLKKPPCRPAATVRQHAVHLV